MFWAIALGLLLVAALLTVWPLMSGGARARGVAVALVLAIPVGAAWLYQGVGTPAALDPAAREPLDAADLDMGELTDRLRERLSETPEDLEGWVLLGRTYKTVQRYDEAVAALETANRLVPDHPIVLVELVEARLFASGDPRMTPEMVALLEQAIAAQPDIQKGYWLLGIAAAQRGDDRAAIGWWEQLLKQVEPGSGVAQAVTGQIAEARMRLGEAPADSGVQAQGGPGAEPDVPPVTEPVTEPDPADAGFTWEVEVTLPDAARETLGEFPAGATLFVIARPAGTAGGPPLGVRRIERPEFPVSVILSDADSMLPQRPISSAEAVALQARLSLSGQPIASAGDWQSAPAPANVTEPTRLQLDQIVE